MRLTSEFLLRTTKRAENESPPPLRPLVASSKSEAYAEKITDIDSTRVTICKQAASALTAPHSGILLEGGSANVVKGSPPHGAIRGKHVAAAASPNCTCARRPHARFLHARALQVDHVVGVAAFHDDRAAKLLCARNSLS